MWTLQRPFVSVGLKLTVLGPDVISITSSSSDWGHESISGCNFTNRDTLNENFLNFIKLCILFFSWITKHVSCFSVGLSVKWMPWENCLKCPWCALSGQFLLNFLMTVFGVGAAETFEFSGVCSVITEIEALTANRLLKAGVFPDHLLSIRRIKNFIIILKIMKFDFSLEIRL